jgi:succinate-semialdehyde dehydrogenase/glutarate-semialdehyde dehydrogenase
VAKVCGEHMKKGTFELGGNDAFIVLSEANLEKAALTAYRSRLNCNAQTGFNAKRFIVEQCVYDEFKDRLLDIIKRKTVIGDPMDERVNLGPMAIPRQMEKLRE